MQIVVMSQNFLLGGQDRWPQIAATINAVRPDILLGQEIRGWTTDSHARQIEAEQSLDMDAHVTPSATDLGPAVLYRRETLGRRTYENHDYGLTETHHGFGVLGWDIPALPTTLLAGSAHFTPYSADKAICEANFAATRVQRKGPFFILGGDINYPPQAGPDPEFDRMKPYNRGARLILGDPENPGPPVADRRVSWTLAANGLVDAAWHLYGKTGDKDLLQRTGSDDRIDQIWVSPALAPAIADYGVVSGGSDHKGVWVRLDLTLADTIGQAR